MTMIKIQKQISYQLADKVDQLLMSAYPHFTPLNSTSRIELPKNILTMKLNLPHDVCDLKSLICQVALQD